MTPENRIPELDFFRGFCILGMIAVHLVYDLTEIYPVFRMPYPPFFLLIKDGGGILFFLLSGISVTLGHSCLRRGAVVLGCAALVSTVTVMTGMPVRFGVLHALGCCMILWLFFQKIPRNVLPYLALLIIALGAVFEAFTVSSPFLYPVGLTAADFTSADFFPLFPYLGYFLAGACLGQRYYPTRRSLLPMLSFSGKASRIFRFCGRHSLLLYLLHQPVLLGAIEAALFLRRELL